MRQQNKGFIQTFIIIALLIIILSLLGISLSSLFSDTLIKENFFFLIGWLSKAWNTTVDFLKDQFTAIEPEEIPEEVVNGAATTTP